MNRSTRILPLLLVLLCLQTTSAMIQAADRKPTTLTLQYAPVDQRPVAAIVPKWIGELAVIPIQISETVMWIVSLDFDEGGKQFHVTINNPSIQSPAGLVDIYSADLELVNGKPIMLLKSTAGTLELTLTTE